jgi:hypothetical protein
MTIFILLKSIKFRSEIDLSESELPEKDLKILEILVERWERKNIFTVV